MPRAAAVVIAVVMIWAPEARGIGLPTAVPPPGQFPVIQPDAVIRLDPDLWMRGLVVNADGTRAFVRATLPTVNAWAYLVGWWPELLGAPLLLWLLVRLRRNRRLRPVAGEEHCRNCGYLVRGLQREQCPECGTALTPGNRVPGSVLRLRVAVQSVAAIALALGYAVFRESLPRHGAIDGWLSIRSPALFHWCFGLFPKIDPLHLAGADDFYQPRDVVIEIDLETGRTVRTLWDRPAVRARCGLVRSPDGAFLFIDGEDAVDQVEIETGRVVRTFGGQGSLPMTAALTGDGRTLYSGDWRYEPQSAARFVFVAWDVETGQATDRMTNGSAPGEYPADAWRLRDAYNDHWFGRGAGLEGVWGELAAAGSAPDGSRDFALFAGAPTLGYVRDAKTRKWLATIPVPTGADFRADEHRLVAFVTDTLHVFSLKKFAAAAK